MGIFKELKAIKSNSNHGANASNGADSVRRGCNVLHQSSKKKFKTFELIASNQVYVFWLKVIFAGVLLVFSLLSMLQSVVGKKQKEEIFNLKMKLFIIQVILFRKGSVNYNKCPVEPMIPVWLLVFGVVGILTIFIKIISNFNVFIK